MVKVRFLSVKPNGILYRDAEVSSLPQRGDEVMLKFVGTEKVVLCWVSLVTFWVDHVDPDILMALRPGDLCNGYGDIICHVEEKP